MKCTKCLLTSAQPTRCNVFPSAHMQSVERSKCTPPPTIVFSDQNPGVYDAFILTP